LAGIESLNHAVEGDNRQPPKNAGEPISLLSIVNEKRPSGAPSNDKGAAPVVPGTTTDQTVNVGADARQFALHVPKNWDGKSPLPVLYYFNGMRPDGKPEPESFTGLSDRADAMGFALAYMRGSNEKTQTYNNGQAIFANSKDENAYLNAVRQAIGKEIPVDEKRQGLAGFSLGGSEAYALAATNSWVSSVQSVEGYMTGYEQPLNHPVSEQNIHALHDPIIPENGTEQVCAQADREAQAVIDAAQYGGDGYIDLLGMFHSVTCETEKSGNNIEAQRSIVDTYKKADGIDAAGNVLKTSGMSIYDFHNPINGAEVRQVTLAKGTHAWAGSSDHSGDIPIIGQPNEEFSASDAIAKFLLEHPLIAR
jgi:poly(3-hydroxybutyrate) depolymerase